MKLIELKDIYKTYHLGQIDVPVLRGISLTVARGEFVALMGTSGSGKTTLMNLLGCLDRPSAGEYRLEGQDVTALSPDERAQLRNQKLGFVFQTFNLLPRTSALENVMMPLSYNGVNLSDDEARERAVNLLPPGAGGAPGARPLSALRRPAAAGGPRPGPGEPACRGVGGRAHR
jgi:ABC-type lipoprotein export system ATPase subunit